MNDSSVAPPGLLDPQRAHRFLLGLNQRVERTNRRRHELVAEHAEQERQDEATWNQRKVDTTEQCRSMRREALQKWDQAEEQLIAGYEAEAVGSRTELRRIAVIFRRKLDEEYKTIDRKYESRLQAVEHQYNSRKNQPALDNQKELAQIEAALGPIREDMDWARSLTIRRLNHIPETPPPETPEEDPRLPPPKSVQQTLDSIDELTRKARKIVGEMQSGTASKVVDSFYLPAATAVFLLIWAIAVLVFVQENWLLWGAVGIGVAFFLAFSVYLILLWPLRKMTRRLHPRIERVFAAAESCATTGRSVSNRNRKESEHELVSRRDEHREAASRWKVEQGAAVKQLLANEESEHRSGLMTKIEQADGHFQGSINTVAANMRSAADQTAETITAKLAAVDAEIQRERQVTAQRRAEEIERLNTRLHDGLRRGKERLQHTVALVENRFPDWESLAVGGSESESSKPQWLDFLPIGWLDLTPLMTGLDDSFPRRLPLALHRRLHSTLIIQADPSRLGEAVEACHSVLWRLLTAAPPSKAKMTLIDPIGRGQNFTEFMALADHDASIVGGRVWTTDEKIEGRLGELAHHVEDILQSSLRDRFERIEDYNQVAGSMAGAYRSVAAVGCPEGLSRGAYRHLGALMGAGIRCGVTTVLVCPTDKPWPSDMPLPEGDHIMNLSIDATGTWRYHGEGWGEIEISIVRPPDPVHRTRLLEQVGSAATDAARVEVPLAALLDESTGGNRSSADELAIPIGSQGADRSLSLRLGQGVAHHALVAGKTGSGKSTLLHAIITSGAYHYSTDELRFYLLDFKKGVEFKCYAESGLPHARVIGIESEREFGLSVLKSLDVEMQQRGEALRSAGAGDLAEYREKTGKTMPRILLIMDEFQELFVRDDRLAADCALLLDRIVRQGRSFGMHAILASQSLAGAYSLPRATLGQMAVRIAMQCGEADAALILSDDNTAARLISRPGEAIYNDAGGLAEGNQPLQVAWLPTEAQNKMLATITEREQPSAESLGPAIVFEGNVPCRWSQSLSDGAVAETKGSLAGLLGEPVEIGPPLALSLSRDSGRNVLIIAPSDAKSSVLATTVVGMSRMNPSTKVEYFDATRDGDGPKPTEMWVAQSVDFDVVRTRDAERRLIQLADEIDRRDESSDPLLIVLDPIERFKDLRPDDSFSFSLDDAGGGTLTGAKAFETVLQNGPSVGIFVLMTCGSAENYSRWIPRSSQHDFELKILGALNPSDSSLLIDSPIAAELSDATLLLYDEADGKVRKFRYCGL